MKLAPFVLVAALALAGCGGGGGENMAKFDADLGAYMSKMTSAQGVSVKITAACTPTDNNAANCDIVIRDDAGTIDKATAENVRRNGDTFVWDHES